jgi:hypothetical protein
VSATIRTLAAFALFVLSMPLVLLAGLLMPDAGRTALGEALSEVVRIMWEGQP